MNPDDITVDITTDYNGLFAGVQISFKFTGDWCNVYDDEPESEEEARRWFITDVAKRLEAIEAGHHHTPAVGQASTEDRGA